MTRSYTEMVREFDEFTGSHALPSPGFPSPERINLRLDLVDEEITELFNAITDSDLVEVADGIADSIYVLCGMAIEFGIPLDEVFEEVHRSNMTKTPDGKREDGKVLKGPNFEPPRIKEILGV